MVAWVRKHSYPSKYEDINRPLQFTDGRRESPQSRISRAEFLERYPFVKDLPPEMTLFEMLDLDDKQIFA